MVIFQDKKFKKDIFKLLPSFLIQQLILTLIPIIANNLMLHPVAKLSEFNFVDGASTGIAASFPLFFIFTSIIGVMCAVGTLFIAQHFGRGNLNLIEFDSYLLLKINLVVSFIFVILALSIPGQILSLLIPSEDENLASAIEIGSTYLRCYSIVYVLTAITSTYYCLMQNVKLEKLAVLDSAICLVLVIAFTAIFVYGVKLGPIGIILSVILSRAAECIIAVIMEHKKGYIHFHFNNFIKLNFDLFKQFSRYLFVLLVCKFVWCMGWIMVISIVSKTNNPDLSLSNVNFLVPMKSLVGAFTASAATALGIVVGRELGANRLTKAKSHNKDIINFCIFTGVVALAIYAFTFLIVYLINFKFFSTPKGMVSFGYLWIIYLIYGTQVIPQTFNAVLAGGLFSSGGDVKFHSLCDCSTYWFLVIPALLIVNFAPNTDPLIIFTILSLEECLKTGLFIKHFYKYKWVNNITGGKGFVFN